MATSDSTTLKYFYEELTPGLEFDLGSVCVTAGLIEAFAHLTRDEHPLHVDANFAKVAGFQGQLAHGALVASLAIGQMVSRGGFNEGIIAMTDLNWRFIRPVLADETIAMRMQITERRLRKEGITGVVGRRFIISRIDGELLQEGHSSAVVRTRQAERALALESNTPSFGSEEWLNKLVERIEQDESFATATASFDGSIALHFGRSSMGVRVYRGRVIDRGRAIVGDATFSIAAPCEVWIEFSKRTRNEFVSFTMSDKFRVSGSSYEYLRMTRAVISITECVRVLLGEDIGRIGA